MQTVNNEPRMISAKRVSHVNDPTTSDQSRVEFPPYGAGAGSLDFVAHLHGTVQQSQLHTPASPGAAGRSSYFKIGQRRAGGCNCGGSGRWQKSHRSEKRAEGSCREVPFSARPLCGSELEGRHDDFPVQRFHTQIVHQNEYAAGFRIDPKDRSGTGQRASAGQPDEISRRRQL